MIIHAYTCIQYTSCNPNISQLYVDSFIHLQHSYYSIYLYLWVISVILLSLHLYLHPLSLSIYIRIVSIATEVIRHQLQSMSLNLFSYVPVHGSCLHIMLLVLYRSSQFRSAMLSSSISSDPEQLSSNIKDVFQSLSQISFSNLNNNSKLIDTKKIWDLIGVDKLHTVDAKELFIAMVSIHFLWIISFFVFSYHSFF